MSVVKNLTVCFPSSAAPANLADTEDGPSRLDRMLQVGEVISSIANAARTFAAKFFPGNTDSVDLDQTASMLTRATEEHDNVLRSAARGGVKVALAMLWAWYPEINMHTATEYMPEVDEQGNAIDQRALISSVSGYASRLAGMVNLGVFHKAYPDPHAEQGETSAAANPEADEEGTDAEAEEVEPTTADAGAGNMDLPPASDEPAAP